MNRRWSNANTIFGLTLAVFWLVVVSSHSPCFGDTPTANCDPPLSLFGITLDMPVTYLLETHPDAKPVLRDGDLQGYQLKLKTPFDSISIRSASVLFGVHQDTVQYVRADLRGRASYAEVQTYFESSFGLPSLLGSSRYRSWWGNNYTRYSVGWERGCGVALFVEAGTLGHPLRLRLERHEGS